MSHKLVKIGRWQRVAAVMLLAFAFVDIIFIDTLSSQFCCNEAGSPASLMVASVARNPAVEHQQSLTKQSAPENSKPASTSEDCFCCCSHIVLNCVFKVETLFDAVRLPLPARDFLPSPPLQTTFRPPRLA